MSSPASLAIVARGPASQGQWKLEHVVPRSIRDDEVLVRVVASGICLADIHFGDVAVEEAGGNPAIWYPRVLGHEGVGWVERVGTNVQNVKAGDPVILSLNSCGSCYSCEEGHPAYCVHLFRDNFCGEREVYESKAGDGFDIGGSFFGQSSFANYSVVKQRCIVSLRGLNVSEEEMQVLAPLGCGVQTGTGAFLNVADVQAHHEVAVLGVGGVGQSAIMAAAMRKCKTIIAIDRDESRLQKARELGATHSINTLDAAIDIVAEVRTITGGRGVHASLDTTGIQSLAHQSWQFVRNHGKVLQVGHRSIEAVWNVSMMEHMNSGKQIIGVVQGDAIPQQYVPQMIEWYRQGKLPVDKIVRRYPVESYQQALEDMRKGAAIKPVLAWPKVRSGIDVKSW